MPLVLGVILWVLGVTAVVVLIVCAIDRNMARQERKD